MITNQLTTMHFPGRDCSIHAIAQGVRSNVSDNYDQLRERERDNTMIS